MGFRDTAPDSFAEQLTRYRRRSLVARLIRVISLVLATCLVIVGAALAATAFQGRASGARVATHYIPGRDGSITLARKGDYALTRVGAELPSCSVRDRDDNDLELRASEEAGDPPLLSWVFTAEPGNYHVECGAGNDGVVVYHANELFIVQHGFLFLLLQSLPFFMGAGVIYLGSRYAAKRIAPESMLPTMPS